MPRKIDDATLELTTLELACLELFLAEEWPASHETIAIHFDISENEVRHAFQAMRIKVKKLNARYNPYDYSREMFK